MRVNFGGPLQRGPKIPGAGPDVSINSRYGTIERRRVAVVGRDETGFLHLVRTENGKNDNGN